METTCFESGSSKICEVSDTDYDKSYYCERTLKRNPYALKAYGFLDLIDCLVLFCVFIYMILHRKELIFWKEEEDYRRIPNEEIYDNENDNNFGVEEDIVMADI